MSQRVSYGSDTNQFFEIFTPPSLPADGLAVMIHGGFWRARYDLTTSTELCAALAHSGFLVANLEYRRVGQPGGGWPGTFEDIEAGFHAVVRHFPKAAKPVVLGHSAGGHLALLLATSRNSAKALPIACVVALAPVACLDLASQQHLGNDAVADFMGASPIPPADPSDFPSPIPRTIVHGVADDIVPIALSRAFVQRRKSDAGHVRLMEIPGANHHDVIDPQSAAWPAVLTSVRAFAGYVG